MRDCHASHSRASRSSSSSSRATTAEIRLSLQLVIVIKNLGSRPFPPNHVYQDANYPGLQIMQVNSACYERASLTVYKQTVIKPRLNPSPRDTM